jgi:hypothetical protein
MVPECSVFLQENRDGDGDMPLQRKASSRPLVMCTGLTLFGLAWIGLLQLVKKTPTYFATLNNDNQYFAEGDTTAVTPSFICSRTEAATD